MQNCIFTKKTKKKNVFLPLAVLSLSILGTGKEIGSKRFSTKFYGAFHCHILRYAKAKRF